MIIKNYIGFHPERIKVGIICCRLKLAELILGFLRILASNLEPKLLYESYIYFEGSMHICVDCHFISNKSFLCAIIGNQYLEFILSNSDPTSLIFKFMLTGYLISSLGNLAFSMSMN